MVTVKKHEVKDMRVRAFSHFLSEEWGLDVLDKYLEIERLCLLGRGEGALANTGLWNHYRTEAVGTADAWVRKTENHLD